jgi:type III secretory pathway component EscV
MLPQLSVNTGEDGRDIFQGMVHLALHAKRIYIAKDSTMVLVNRELFVLIRIVASFVTASALIFFTSSLSGEDLFKNNNEIKQLDVLSAEIRAELVDGIQQRINQLGEVPEKNPFRKFYCVELAKEVHELSDLTEKQRMLFDNYNVRSFEVQLRRMMEYTNNSDVKSLMDELEIVKRELRNSANLIDKRKSKLIRQRTAYIVLFVIFWIVLYLYYSRGIIFKKGDAD